MKQKSKRVNKTPRKKNRFLGFDATFVVFLVLLVLCSSSVFIYLFTPIQTTKVLKIPPLPMSEIVTYLNELGNDPRVDSGDKQYKKANTESLDSVENGFINSTEDMEADTKEISENMDEKNGVINKILKETSFMPRNQFHRIDVYIMKLVGAPKTGLLDLDINGEFKGEDFITLSRLDFFKRLHSAKRATIEIMLIPGETNYFFLANLAKMFSFNPYELQAAYDKYFHLKDGVIPADTYRLPLNLNADELMSYFAKISYEWHKKRAQELLGSYDREKWFYIVRIASIIQKESSNIEEMPFVSAVIHNRLKKRMRLQMDGALNYGEFSHTKVTPERIRGDKSLYNTYKHYGIPEQPIGSISINAIKAAINPADVDYLYFVRTKDGKHAFTNTFEDHRSNFDK